MTDYTPLASEEESVIQRRGQHQHDSPAEENFNGSGAVRKEWWWQAGPVDSCCCCCSLRAGVVLIALDSLFAGLWIVFAMRTFGTVVLDSSLELMNSQYMERCEGRDTSTPQCEQLKGRIEEAEVGLELYRHLPTLLYVQGVLSIVAGVIGFWAVFFRSRRAARAFMLSWPAKFVLAVVGTIQLESASRKNGVELEHPAWLYVLTMCFLLYYTKVSWSFYKKRLDYDNDCVRRSNTNRTAASPGTVCRDQPMAVMNPTTIV